MLGPRHDGQAATQSFRAPVQDEKEQRKEETQLGTKYYLTYEVKNGGLGVAPRSHLQRTAVLAG